MTSAINFPEGFSSTNGFGSTSGPLSYGHPGSSGSQGSVPVRRATGLDGRYSDGSLPFQSTDLGKTLGAVADVIGKIWALPNTIIGLTAGILALPFEIANGGGIGFGNNSIQFTGFPLGAPEGGALTLGNVQLFHNGEVPFTPDSTIYDSRYTGLTVNAGFHEQGHTWQYQILGAFFLPVYFLNGGISPSNPFERAADYYATGGSWWPGGH